MKLVMSRARFGVLMVVSMNIILLRNVDPCGLADLYRRFREFCCLHHGRCIYLSGYMISHPIRLKFTAIAVRT
jgi:hypothetical protein